MKRMIRNLGMITVLTLAGILTFGSALADTIEGTVQGLQCVVSGKVCPIDNQDPHLAAEDNFVVYTKGKSYHFVTNLDRAILARYIGKKVRVSGKESTEYKAITAEKFEVFTNGGWQTKWTLEEEKRQRERQRKMLEVGP